MERAEAPGLSTTQPPNHLKTPFFQRFCRTYTPATPRAGAPRTAGGIPNTRPSRNFGAAARRNRGAAPAPAQLLRLDFPQTHPRRTPKRRSLPRVISGGVGHDDPWAFGGAAGPVGGGRPA